MKKLIALGAAAGALVSSAFASGSRGAAAYFAATQDCITDTAGVIQCTPKETGLGISVMVIIVLAGVGLYLWKRKKK